MGFIINPYRFLEIEDSLSFVASAGASASTSVTIPPTAQSGDIGVIVSHAVNQNGSGNPTDVTPSGWTKATTNAGNELFGRNVRVSIYQKVLTSGDPNSSVTGLSGDADQEQICLVFRPSNPVSSLSNTVTNGQVTNIDPSSQTVGAQTEPYLVIGEAGASNDGVGALNPISPSSPAPDGSTYVERMEVGYWIYNIDEGTSVTIDQDDEGLGNALTSISIEPTFS